MIDLTRILAGPFCSMLLADLDAHETPGEGDPVRRQDVGRYGLSCISPASTATSLTLNLQGGRIQLAVHRGLQMVVKASGITCEKRRLGDFALHTVIAAPVPEG